MILYYPPDILPICCTYTKNHTEAFIQLFIRREEEEEKMSDDCWENVDLDLEMPLWCPENDWTTPTSRDNNKKNLHFQFIYNKYRDNSISRITTD